MKPRPILTITLNPALDLTGNLAELNAGHVNVMQSGHLHPAGKGINVARVLKDLGAQVRVSGFLGADNAAPFQALFADYGFDDRFAVIPGATRINVKLVEQNAQAALTLSDVGYVLEVGNIMFSDTGRALLGDDRVKRAYLGAD